MSAEAAIGKIQAALPEMDIPTRHAATMILQWQARARPKQMIPFTDPDWTEILIQAGRRWGKTETGIRWAAEQLLLPPEPRFNLMIVARTFADIDRILQEPTYGLYALTPPPPYSTHNKSTRRGKFWNGATYECYSAEEPQSIRGGGFHAAYCDEVSTWRYPDTFANIDASVHKGRGQKLFTSTLKRNEMTRELLRRIPETHRIRGATNENTSLTQEYIDNVKARYGGTLHYRQEYLGEFIDIVPGALFTSENITKNRLTPEDVPPDNHMFAVGIDPQGAHRRARADKDDSAALLDGGQSETGIVVVSTTDRQHFYVWEDASKSASPDEWARTVAAMAHKYGGADNTFIIAETNYGGDMVIATLERAAPDIAIRTVHAMDSKIVRAQPVSLLYEQNRVHHVGIFAEMEEQMTSFTAESRESPDRMDALVWAITALAAPAPGFY